jgi:hypothetical protein
MKTKIWIFFHRVQWTHLTMVPKVTPMGLLSYVQKIKNPQKNQDRVANNDFDLQNDFHEDRLSFPVYGEKINLGQFSPFLRLAVLKVQNFCLN